MTPAEREALGQRAGYLEWKLRTLEQEARASRRRLWLLLLFFSILAISGALVVFRARLSAPSEALAARPTATGARRPIARDALPARMLPAVVLGPGPDAGTPRPERASCRGDRGEGAPARATGLSDSLLPARLASDSLSPTMGGAVRDSNVFAPPPPEAGPD